MVNPAERVRKGRKVLVSNNLPSPCSPECLLLVKSSHLCLWAVALIPWSGGTRWGRCLPGPWRTTKNKPRNAVRKPKFSANILEGRVENYHLKGHRYMQGTKKWQGCHSIYSITCPTGWSPWFCFAWWHKAYWCYPCCWVAAAILSLVHR